MNAYKLGIVIPSRVLPRSVVRRVEDVQAIRRSHDHVQSRFYRSGIAGRSAFQKQTEVGAFLGGTAGGFVDTMVSVLLDLAHIGLLAYGLYVLVLA